MTEVNKARVPKRGVYPSWRDFDIDQITYGLGAPVVGIGIYTLDKKFSWPDRECTFQTEYLNWKQWLEDQGYEMPFEYRNAFVRDKKAGGE